MELDIPQNDPESKIATLENVGIKLYKRNLKISDVSGDNFVIVQFASEDESTLNNYLQETTFRLILGDVFQKIDNIQSSTSTNIKPLTDKIDIL